MLLQGLLSVLVNHLMFYGLTCNKGCVVVFGLRVHGLLPTELKYVFVQIIGRGELTHNPKSIYKSVHVEKNYFLPTNS